MPAPRPSLLPAARVSPPSHGQVYSPSRDRSDERKVRCLDTAMARKSGDLVDIPVGPGEISQAEVP